MKFESELFGSFKQRVVFDFNDRPVLFRELRVDVGKREVHETIQAIQERLTIERWNSDNQTIIAFSENKICSEFDQKLIARYSKENNELL